jgi:hypothetical protein
MSKEMLVIPVNRVVDKKRIKMESLGLEERHKGSLTSLNLSKI